MRKTLDKILEESKAAYKKSVQIDDKILETHLLSILLHTQYLSNEFQKITKIQKIKVENKSEILENEIKKVTRKVPLWLRKPDQVNYKILKTFMNLSNNNKYFVNITTLESHVNLEDPKKFLANYNMLKTITQKNHAKVFEEKNGQVQLWEPIAKIVIDLFS